MDDTLFVEVILPLPLPGTYTYRVPAEYNGVIATGQRVVVQFGIKHLYAAIVRKITTDVPSYKVKYVLSILDLEPIVTELQMQFWEWMAQYYMCHLGDVMAVALPSAFRLASESSIAIHPDFTGELTNLSDNELRIVNILSEHPVMKLADISRALGIQKIMPIVNTMVERQIIVLDEDLRERYLPKKRPYIALSQQYKDEQACKALFDTLESSKSTQRQVNLLLDFMQRSNFGAEALPKSSLKASSTLQTLIRKGILVVEEREESRLETFSADQVISPDSIVLNDEQQAAFDYLSSPEVPNVSLLHGVTSSGKTEVYIKLIQGVLEQGKQVLFLLPEIALTAQLINRLRKYFGNYVGVYHSRFSVSQRAEVWSRTMSPDPEKRYRVLLGARSAVFLPFRDLGLVIVDEEHDTSFKQAEPAPRYNGRDAALYVARLYGARAVLGSATPSIETYFMAQEGKYGLAVMKHRFGGIQMPEVLCVDMKEAHRKKEVRGSFSVFLLDNIEAALKANKQVILFQNRRGFSLHLECAVCHHIPQCQHCDVSLVYHKSTNSLRCHYCGYSIPVPSECPACNSTQLSMRGVGTERIEEDLSIIFPDAKVARMDLDTTLQKSRYIELISDFQDRKINILVGTQMITKGLDFDNVAVVGIVSADNLINYPDFRSFERAFQQMTQVSGRAGRRGERGKVIIQTYNPYHQAIRNVIDNDYADMYHSQIVERRVFRYPPYYRLIEITLKHRNKDVVDEAMFQFSNLAKSTFGNRVIGPTTPMVSRVRSLYIKTLMVRFERNEPLASAKAVLTKMADDTRSCKEYASVLFQFNVDPC
ncbi:MAG: primosomal protein N' [Bacteroidales bacterium]|nr:primosomal protein N' [Bacteroidales bacterium]